MSPGPDACARCGVPWREHMQDGVLPVDGHAWVRPSTDQILTRAKGQQAVPATDSQDGGT
ncbi:hypothetical protein ACPC54_23965 [Kitasatospora sp. NPDC094028]